MQYDVVIGLEVHAELKTESKCFCSCANVYGGAANSNCCPVCVGLPGALPILNKKAVEQTIKAGLALNFEINKTAVFERKNYFYPDLAKAYQISQLEKPICINGHLRVGEKDIPINRIHLEEDAGKLVHENGKTLIDYNRGGVPLIELVTDALKEPHLETADEAIEFLTKLRQIYIYAGISDCKMEKGQMRADINISLKPKGSKTFGTKVEMKNVMGFRSIHRAIEYEIERQKEILNDGGIIEQETRKWDFEKDTSFTLRTKENAEDYRYFPDPDLLAVEISEGDIEKIKNTMPILPEQIKQKYIEEYGLSEYDADVILADKDVANLYQECVNLFFKPKEVANWFTAEILARIKKGAKLSVSKENLVWIMKAVSEKKIQRDSGKGLLSRIWGTTLDAEKLAKELDLMADLSNDVVFGVLEKVLKEKASVVEQYKREQDPKILNFLVGQVMKETRGKASAQEVMEKLKEKVKEN